MQKKFDNAFYLNPPRAMELIESVGCKLKYLPTLLSWVKLNAKLKNEVRKIVRYFNLKEKLEIIVKSILGKEMKVSLYKSLICDRLSIKDLITIRQDQDC